MEKQGIIIHILKKRAMENYMPSEVIVNLYSIVKTKSDKSFRDWLNSQSPKNWITTYKDELTSEQKDYSNYQDGLTFPNFKTEFPKFFQYNDYISKTSLLAREGGSEENNEFLTIINKIYSLL